MAQGIVTHDRRATRAQGIVERHECELLDNGTWRVRDTATGSGKWHIADTDRCDCYDSIRGTCKHQLAVRREEQALAQYCADWNARAEQARVAAGPRCPTCGAGLEARQYYIGGKGYKFFMVCTRDAQHRTLPA